MQVSGFRVSTVAVALASAAALLLAACSGGSNSALETVGTPSATTADGAAIPTATPYARIPEPTIVSGAVGGALSTSQISYLVEAGDTLSAIAERFDTTDEDIMAENGLTDTVIFVGQTLLIPSGSALASNTPAPPADDSDADTATDDASADDSGLTEYEVQPGDSALAIAFRFDVTIDALAAANGTTFEGLDNLQVGDVLFIP